MADATIGQLTAIALKFRDERDWKQFHNPKDLAINLMLEAAELMEHMQWKSGRELQRALKARHEDVADELSDVLHSVILLANDLGIDLSEAFQKKMKKNERKYPAERVRGSSRKYTEYKEHAP